MRRIKKVYNFDLSKEIPVTKNQGIREMLDDYGSVITTFGLNDYDQLLHSTGGLGSKKYATISVETWFSSYLHNNEPIDSLLDINDINWSQKIGLYIHEFTHTVEMYYNYGEIYEYHKATVSMNDLGLSSLEKTRLYLLNQVIIDGEKVGIPY